MRILVCGGRDYENADVIGRTMAMVASGRDHVLVHGGARGADTVAARIAEVRGWEIEEHPARWREYGPAAGPMRNQQMVDGGADVVLAFPGGRGTEDLVRRATAAGLTVHLEP